LPPGVVVESRWPIHRKTERGLFPIRKNHFTTSLACLAKESTKTYIEKYCD
jgi:hypothetical protein